MEKEEKENKVVSPRIFVISQWALILTMFFGGVAYLHHDMANINSAMTTGLAQQSQRTDKLYEMFIELVKDGKK